MVFIRNLSSTGSRFGLFSFGVAASVAAMGAFDAVDAQAAGGGAKILNCQDAQLPPTTKRDFQCIDEGFRLFTEETFEGNGRTCGTCHIPEENYNIFPDTIKKMSRKERRLVFASNVPGLENETLVRKFALFNIAGGPESDASDIEAFNSPEAQAHPHDFPIFRSSMTVQSLDTTRFVGGGGFDGTPLLPAVCSEGNMVDGTGASIPVVDSDGNQVRGGPGGGQPLFITVRSQLAQLGWSGDGSPGTPKGRTDEVTLFLGRREHAG